MIRNFKHKGLKRFFLKNDSSKLNAEHVIRIGDILFLLNSAKNIQRINAPGLRLHSLKGDLEGYWSVTVTANYRIIFRFNEEKQEVYDVDYIDYHGK